MHKKGSSAVSKLAVLLLASVVFVVFYVSVGCVTSPSPGKVGVGNIGASFDKRTKTAHIVYTSVTYPEDGWIIDRFVRENDCAFLILYLLNGGGDGMVMFDVCTVLSNLRKSGVHITTVGSSLVASAAVPIYVQGDRRILMKYTSVMMHPSSWHGKEAMLTKPLCDLFTRMDSWYATLVSDRTNMTFKEVYDIITTGDATSGCRFFTAEQALELGIATELEE